MVNMLVEFLFMPELFDDVHNLEPISASKEETETLNTYNHLICLMQAQMNKTPSVFQRVGV